MFISVIHKQRDTVYKYSDHLYLHEDRWDDWFSYVTMFSAVYVDKNSKEHYLGSVKIGKTGIQKSELNATSGRFETIDHLPTHFDRLDSSFFSLGQSDDYYVILNKLGDQTKQKILEGLNDIAYDNKLLNKVHRLKITTDSLLRSVSITTVRGQFRRIIQGGARLTDYNFSYTSSETSKVSQIQLTFEVIPESNPPTNIHVIIGRNGVGKTYLMRNMINSLIINDPNKYGTFNVSTCGNVKKSAEKKHPKHRTLKLPVVEP